METREPLFGFGSLFCRVMKEAAFLLALAAAIRVFLSALNDVQVVVTGLAYLPDQHSFLHARCLLAHCQGISLCLSMLMSSVQF